ncbi:MAG: glycosyltransferase family 39 protein [Vicinamibacterales bacterium]
MITRTVLVLLLAGAALLYGNRLAFAPPYVEIDEVLIGLDAREVASSGRDLRGEFLPLYSQTAEHSWYQPAVIYLTAFALKILPLAEWSVRAPTACLGLLDIALIYLVARHLFGSVLFGAIAAGLLALSPAHFIHSRYGMDYLYPVPFVLGWLLCLVLYNQRGHTWLLVAGMCLLGVGFYSYIAAIVLMPLYAALTLLLLLRQRAPRRSVVLAVGGFVAWLIPFVVWIARHPNVYQATVEKYGLYDPKNMDAVQGFRSFISYESVSARLSDFWNFYNPAFLFFGSGTKLMFSTNRVGVFLLPVAVFLLIGVAAAWRNRRSSIDMILLAGFATAPLAALIVAEEHAIFRALVVLPFGILLATAGVQQVWIASTHRPLRPIYRPVAFATLSVGIAYGAWTLATQGRLTSSTVPLLVLSGVIWMFGALVDRSGRWRPIAWCLLALAVLQFGAFWRDYFSDYRVRSGYWLGGNIRGALEDIIARAESEQVPRIYFATLQSSAGQVDGRDQYMDAYWKFYLVKHRQEALLPITGAFDSREVQGMPRGSLVLANVGNRSVDALVARGDLTVVDTIEELDGESFFKVLRR